MEFDRKSLGLLKLKGDDGLRELARKKGIKLKKGAGKEDVITALLRSLPNKDFKQGFNINRAAPPPPPGMTQEQAKVEIKKRLDIMIRETYDKNSLLTTQNERTAQIAEYDRIRRATQAFERSEAVREIQEVADRLNAQRNVDIWGEDEDFGEMILSFQEMTDSNTEFFFAGADKSKEGLEIASLYEDEFQYNQIVDGGENDNIDLVEYEKELKLTKQQKINKAKNQERIKRYGVNERIFPVRGPRPQYTPANYTMSGVVGGVDLRNAPRPHAEELMENISMGNEDERERALGMVRIGKFYSDYTPRYSGL